MAYHAINEGGVIPVYQWSSCASESQVGNLYNGEVFTFLKEHSGYLGHYEIRFLNSEGKYANGFINTGQYGNLVYSGTRVTVPEIGSTACYRFKLRRTLSVVYGSGSHRTTLYEGDYVFSRSATAGDSNYENMHIVGYQRGSTITAFDGFVTLDYESGSMFATNFCLAKG